MPKVDTSRYKDFDQVLDRLDQILVAVRDKNTSLEKSLDLFDEAIAVGSKGVEMVDKVEFSEREEAMLAGAESGSSDSVAEGTPESAVAESEQKDGSSRQEGQN